MNATAKRLIELDKQYHTMDAKQTRREFTRLDSLLNKSGEQIAHALEAVIPHLSDVQLLTSQRGDERQKVLSAAKVPAWSVYMTTYADKYGVSARTIRRKIFKYRGKSSVTNKPASRKVTVVSDELVAKLETAERYIAALEDVVYSFPLTDVQEAKLRKSKEPWRKILRSIRPLAEAA
jgi:hypothetical protein